jgi:hypothetical protein
MRKVCLFGLIHYWEQENYVHGSSWLIKSCVYSANNEGFWCPEFIRLTKGDNEFDALILAWFNFLTGVFGL